jgi:predicted nuclease with TOPRIM domain
MIDFNQTLEELAAKFPEQYENYNQIQAYVTSIELEYFQIQNKLGKYEQNSRRREEDLKERMQELRQVNDHIPVLEQSLETLTDTELLTQYRVELNQEKQKKMKLEEWMNRNNANKLNNDFINYQLNRTSAAYIDAVAHKLCEWFATGAAGPGKVVYREKVYEVNE